MDWKSGEPHDFLVSQALVAPVDKVAEILQRYKSYIPNPLNFGFCRPYLASDDFERAVFQRNDAYLNLLLSSCVSDAETAVKLWEWAENSSYPETLKNTVKCGTLSFYGAVGLIVENEYGYSPNVSRNAKISLVKVFTDNEGKEYLPHIFRNPSLKGLLAKILLRKDEFSVVSEEAIPFLYQSLSRNPGLNVDKTDNEGPDLEQWKLSEAIKSAFLNAPLNCQWLDALRMLALSINPESIYFEKEELSQLCRKWFDGTVYGLFEDDKPESERVVEEGLYTSMSGSQEFATLMMARFSTGKFASLEDGL
uniref:hypothetical protein n=1 Tax=Flavobacterium sp. TaxID=239 RepID=UPI0037BFB18E